MSTPGTPQRQSEGDGARSPPADPLTVKPAHRQHQHQLHEASEGEYSADSRPASPFSFKRRGVAVSGSPSPALAAGAARRSLSNFFSRRASAGSDSNNPSATNKLSLPPPPAFGGHGPLNPQDRSLLSPQATPTRRTSGAARKVSNAAGGRAYSRNLSPGAISPGGLRGRIHDWQRTASYSPGPTNAADTRSDGGEGRDIDDEDDDRDYDFEDSRLENEPIIPKMLPELRTPEHQTPLPKLPIVVLAICMVGEFLSASVGGPFLFFMLEDLGVPGGGGESAVGFWAGIVSASFFLTQFATALLWASAAARYGRRAVLFASLFGNTLALLLYGSCRSVILMVVIRMFQGAFNGAVGVARSAVKDITDSTNEGRAYSIVGLAWSLGGILGPAIGGWTEHPVENLPNLFGNSRLYASFPYLLPCSIAAAVTGTGAVLCLFLSYDAGPREGGIRLPEEKDVERAVHKVASLPGSVKKKVSGYFGPSLTAHSSPEQAHDITSPGIVNGPGGILNNGGQGSSRRESNVPRQRTSFAIPHRGSAYGYDPRRRDTALSRFRKMSTATSTKYAPDFEGLEYEPAPLNFAQRLLLANDEAGVFNITDLWVAAATREDGLPYTSANLEEDVFADEEDESMAVGNETRDTEDRDPFSDEASVLGVSLIGRKRHDTMASGSIAAGRQGSPMRASRTTGLRHRANSTVSTASRPAIYQNTGLVASPVTSPAPRRENLGQPYLQQPPTPSSEMPPSNLAAIPEGKASSAISDQLAVPGPESSDSGLTVRGAGGEQSALAVEPLEKDPLQDFSIMRDLPIKLIAQYSVLALHGTIMDQIFMSFLVSKTAAGGLGLQASDFADIIACMCFFQMLFQFRFYPTVSMPIGRLTHVQMFRLGLLLYLIPYILFPELRPLLGPGGERTGTVTFGLILLTATRYLANTCSYTAVMILINAMTPPPYIPMANGLAQSVVSLARFIGPLTGGILWSKSIADGPEGYYIGFMVVAAICTTGFLHSFTIR